MMEAVCTSETSVSLYQTTRRDIPEDSHLHMRFSSVEWRDKISLKSTALVQKLSVVF
jgi:hypothetical protein